MGIDYRAAIFIGLPRGEILNQESLSELIDEGEIEICPPHYDGNGEDYAIAGYEYAGSGTYSASEFKYDDIEINKMKNRFKLIFNQDAKIFISPYGY